MGKEIAGRADKPSARENLNAAIHATEWRVQQQKEGIKDEPEPFRQGWKAGVDNAIRAEFIAALPPPPPPPSPEEHHSRTSGAHLETVYYVILYDGSDDEAQDEMVKAQRAGLPARVFESRELPVTGPPATLVAIGPFKTPGITQEVVVRSHRAGFPDAYSVRGRE